MAIKRLTAWTTLNTISLGDTSSITIPSGNKRLLISVGGNGSFDTFGGELPAVTPSGMKCWDEAQLAAMGASEPFNAGSVPPGGIKTWYAFFENIDQTTPYNSGQGNSFQTLTWNYSGLPGSRVVIGKTFCVGNVSLGAGGSPNPLTEHFEVHFSAGGSARTIAMSDNLATNSANDAYATDYAASGSYTLSSSPTSTYAHRINAFNGAAETGGDYASTTTATSTVTPNLEVTRPLVAFVGGFGLIVTDAKLILNATFISSTAVTSVLGPTPTLDVTRALVSTTTASALVTGDVKTGGLLDSTTTATSTVTSNINVTRALVSTTAATATVTSSVRNITPQFATTVAATSTVSGSFLRNNGKPEISAVTTFETDTPQEFVDVTLPTHVAGDLIAVFVGHGDNQNSWIDYNNSSSYWEHIKYLSIFSTDVGGSLNWKVADSASETLRVTSQPGFDKTWYVVAYTIKNANAAFLRADSYGLVNAPPHPVEFLPITMDKSRDILSFVVVPGEADSIMTAAPSGYDIIYTRQGSNGSSTEGSLSIAARDATTTTEAPGTATMSQPANAHIAGTFIAYKRADTEPDFQFRQTLGDQSTWQFTIGAVPPDLTIIDRFWAHDSATEPTTWRSAQSFPSPGTSPSPISSEHIVAAQAYTDTFSATPLTTTLEFNGTWEDLGMNNVDYSYITGYDDFEIYWAATVNSASWSVQLGTASNPAIEITDPNGTYTLIPAQSAVNTTTGWTLASHSPAISSFYPANSNITIRIYGTLDNNNETSFDPNLWLNDLIMNVSVQADNAGERTFSTTVSATSTVTPSLATGPGFAAVTNATSTATGSLNINLPGAVARDGDFSPNGTYYAVQTGTGDSYVNIWQRSTNNRLSGIPQLTRNLTGAIAWRKDSAQLAFAASGSGSGDYLRVINVPALTTVSGPPQIYTNIFSLSFNDDGSLLAIATNNGLFIYETATWTLDQTLNSDSAGDKSVEFSPDGAYVGVVTNGGSLKVYETTTWTTELDTTIGTPGQANDLTWSQDNNYLVVSGNLVPGWYIFDVGSPWTETTAPVDLVTGIAAAQIKGIDFTSDSNRIVTTRQSSSSVSTDVIVIDASDPSPSNWSIERIFDRDLVTFATTGTSTFSDVNDDLVLVSGSGFTQFSSEFDEFEIINISNKLRSTIAGTSSVTSNLDVSRTLQSTTTVASVVTGNIDPTRKLITAIISQSAVVEPTQFNVIRGLVSTTTAASLVTANVGLTVFFESLTTAVSTVNPNQFFFGFEASVAATSTVTPTLDRQPKFSTTVAATSTVTAQEWRDISREFACTVTATSALDTTAIERGVGYVVPVTSVSSLTVAPFLRDATMRADFNGFSVTVGDIRLAGKFQTVVTATSAIDPTELERLRNYQTLVPAQSALLVNSEIGKRLFTTIVGQSAVLTPTRLQITRNMETTIPGVAAFVVQPFDRNPDFTTTVAVTTFVEGTVVVITNTLVLTWTSGEYFTEVQPYVLQLTTDTFNDTAIVNEVLDDISLTSETLPDVTVDSTDEGPQ